MKKVLSFAILFTHANGKQQKAGELLINIGTPGKLSGQFKYNADWIKDPNCPAICPISLPKQSPPFPITNRPHAGIPLSLEDMLPDAWGKGLITRLFDLPPSEQSAPFLLDKISSPLGALSAQKIPPERYPIFPQPELSYLISCLDKYGFIQLNRQEMESMTFFGSGSGGARPKFQISRNNKQWIAKPSHKKDDFPVIHGEFLCLQLAKTIGLPTPNVELLRIEPYDVLLVERFDYVFPNGKRHFLSFKSLLQSEDFISGSYLQMANVIQRISHQPQEDCEYLFKIMILNILLGNIDDHLKNFAMTWDIHQKWRLSPLYDITPAAMLNQGFGNKYHSIGFKTPSDNSPPAYIDIIDIGQKMMVDNPAEIFLAIQYAVENFRCTLPDKMGIAGENWSYFIKERLDKLHPEASPSP